MNVFEDSITFTLSLLNYCMKYIFGKINLSVESLPSFLFIAFENPVGDSEEEFLRAEYLLSFCCEVVVRNLSESLLLGVFCFPILNIIVTI